MRPCRNMRTLRRVEPSEARAIISGLERASGLKAAGFAKVEDEKEGEGRADVEEDERARTLRILSEASREILIKEEDVTSRTGLKWLRREKT